MGDNAGLAVADDAGLHVCVGAAAAAAAAAFVADLAVRFLFFLLSASSFAAASFFLLQGASCRPMCLRGPWYLQKS
jgi:hypothetical protein